MGKGYSGKILRVDLSERKVWTEKPDEFTYRTYLGGAGLAVQYLLKELPKNIDPLSPDNVLQRGYTITTDSSTGRVITDVADLEIDDHINTHFAIGHATSQVIDKYNEDSLNGSQEDEI